MSIELPEAAALVVAHAPPRARAGLTALFALDRRCADIVRSTTQPIIGQMRLTWWRDSLEALDVAATAPAEPVLQAIVASVLPYGIRGAALATITEGWMLVLTDEIAAGKTLADYAAMRGGGIFAAAATILGADATATTAQAGAGWAMADLAAHVADRDISAAITEQAEASLRETFAKHRWPGPLRPIGMLALLSLLELEHANDYARLLRAVRFRATGR